jgi:hypothetical protein
MLHQVAQEPVLRLLNLQLQSQRCSRLERFHIGEEEFLFQKRAKLLVALLIITTPSAVKIYNAAGSLVRFENTKNMP